MDSDTEIILSALKFVCGETENVCRLCFSSTEKEKVSLDDNVRLLKVYFDDTVTFADMFDELGVTMESSLPQTLCMICATCTIKSYLFRKRCQYSNEKWNEVLDRAMHCVSLADAISPTEKLASLMLDKDGNRIFTSRKVLLVNDKENALSKLKYIMRRRFRYKKQKEKNLKIKCDECGERFSTANALHKHMKIHSDVKSRELRCSRCSRLYNNRPSFKYHVIRCGRFTKKEANFFCDVCDKGYVNKKGLQVHLKMSHGFGKFVTCEYCGKKFDYRSKLQTHMVTHTGIKYNCQQCGAKFSTESKLICHTRLHTGEKPFDCDFCDESFHSSAKKMDHIYRKHSGPEFIITHELKSHILRRSKRNSKLYVSTDKEEQQQDLVDYETIYIDS